MTVLTSRFRNIYDIHVKIHSRSPLVLFRKNLVNREYKRITNHPVKFLIYSETTTMHVHTQSMVTEVLPPATFPDEVFDALVDQTEHS